MRIKNKENIVIREFGDTEKIFCDVRHKQKII